MTTKKITFTDAPKFLSMLGSVAMEYDDSNDTSAMKFDISSDYTHSNGTIVQGGFITAMLDTSMAHLIILKTDGKINPLTLNVNVNFIASGSPGKFVASSTLDKIGRTIAFTSSELHQNGKLIATATATNKLIAL